MIDHNMLRLQGREGKVNICRHQWSLPYDLGEIRSRRRRTADIKNKLFHNLDTLGLLGTRTPKSRKCLYCTILHLKSACRKVKVSKSLFIVRPAFSRVESRLNRSLQVVRVFLGICAFHLICRWYRPSHVFAELSVCPYRLCSFCVDFKPPTEPSSCPGPVVAGHSGVVDHERIC